MYVEKLDEAVLAGQLRAEEGRLLDRFERYAADILDRYVPPGLRRGDSLVFAELYAAGVTPPAEEPRRRLIAALLAGETEARGPLRLTRAQSIRLAEVFERLGAGLGRERLPLHAAHAFDRAAGLYLQVEENGGRDRCLLARSRARHRARPPGVVKALEAVSDLLAGYGYQPYRLFGFVLVQLAVFILLLTQISDTAVGQDAYMVLMNYLNPLGFGDTRDMPHSTWVLFVIEGYSGSVSLSIFFALLVRKWFRL
ncbi:hypothetical protein F0L68_01715 [Solihabitans fulvus]|uniref:Uncharacterized protein n=1 Tax=Solihabitans fulvus TaxID=1892852 RepID=A0A5B2XSR6_9PSEU|nr:hypothetical protein [Solihabitans fulvus]KAA2266486.1 hypothetical protein F0L68_01715 [Solihabitans fulvus]